MKHPIKLRRLYSKTAPTDDFVIVAEPLPAATTANWSEAEHIARREAERKAIDAEWTKIRRRSTSAQKP